MKSSEMTPEQSKAWRAFLWAPTVIMRNLEREMRAAAGLPLSWFDVLIHLHEAPQRRLRLQALAESVVLSRSGLTRLIDRMEKAGVVRREQAADDRRGSYAVLTSEGRRRFEQVEPGHVRRVNDHFARHLTAAETRALTATLSKLIAANEEPD
ncbi:MAG: MarR family transcriptional regulator [Chloroflexi bacterium]|nr:MarR family transcriptional regulator [Chloroflexota bacterium]